ncbi:hypothetical protein CAL7716_099390 [Calothrix sp. PCC 7716]|nr:hypothetical protein CAL7716_099390 [Calothrix sp. PCC 7716]
MASLPGVRVWLRFYDEAGNLVLLPEEAEKQRADAERQGAYAERQGADAARQVRLNAVSQLLQMGMSIEQVAQILSLTVEEVQLLSN